MKVISIVTLLLLATSSTSSTSSDGSWGSVQIVLKQSGLTTITEYLEDHLVKALHRTTFGEYYIYSVIINNIKLIRTEKVTTTADLKPNNTVDIIASFGDIFIEANVTINNPGNVLKSPATIINIKGASIGVRLLFGRGPKGDDVDFKGCHTVIENMQLENVSKQAEALLQVAWRIGKSEVFEYVKDFCPHMQKLTRSKFKDLLAFEGYFKTEGDGPISLPMDFRFNDMSTDDQTLNVKFTVGFTGSVLPPFGSGDVQFPDPAVIGFDSKKELEFWFDQDLLNLLGKKAIQIQSVVPTSFMVFTSESNDFMVDLESQNSTLVSSKDGIVLNLTFTASLIQQSKKLKNCVVIRTFTEAILPFSVNINNTWLQLLTDPKRYQMNTTILSWDIAYRNCGPVNPHRDPLKFQRTVLHKFTQAFDVNYNYRLGYAKLWTDDFLSLQETTLETLDGCAVVTANLARNSAIKVEKTIRSENKYYLHSDIEYVYTDHSREVYVNGKLKPTSLGYRPLANGLMAMWMMVLVLLLV